MGPMLRREKTLVRAHLIREPGKTRRRAAGQGLGAGRTAAEVEGGLAGRRRAVCVHTLGAFPSHIYLTSARSRGHTHRTRPGGTHPTGTKQIRSLLSQSFHSSRFFAERNC